MEKDSIEKDNGSVRVLLLAWPEDNSLECDLRSQISDLYECLSYSWDVDAFYPHGVLEGQRHTDLEMAMGSYSDGCRFGIEGGKACDCAVCFGLVNVQNSFKASCIDG